MGVSVLCPKPVVLGRGEFAQDFAFTLGVLGRCAWWS
jgi:hypothetical protein